MADDGLVAALARCQAKFPAIVKSHTNPAFKGSQYADIADVLAAVRPILAAEGIAVIQPLEYSAAGTFLITKLMLGDEEIKSELVLPDPGAPQQFGSLLTYMRRYQLCALLGVHPVGDDDDGNLAATAQTAPPKPASRTFSEALETYATARKQGPIAPPDKPIAAMTMSEIIGYARENGIPLPSGSKAELIRHLEPLVRAQTGEEPFALEGAEPIEAKDDVQDKPFEPVVANPATGVKDELRLLKPDARASVRRGD